MDKTARVLGAHRKALGTFHHEQKKSLMEARKAWFKLTKKLPTWALSKNLEGQIATAVPRSSLDEVRGFSNKTRKIRSVVVPSGIWDHETEAVRFGTRLENVWLICELPAK